MKRICLFFIMSLSLFGCNFGCEVESTISTGLSGAIASSLNCTNTTAIQTSVTNILNLTKICDVAECRKDRKLGTIANLVCPVVASTAVAYLGSQIPADWACQPSGAVQTVSGAVTASCELLPF